MELVLCGLTAGEYAVELLSPVRLHQTFASPSGHKSIFFLNPAFANPQISEVSVRVQKGTIVKEFVIPLFVHKLTGQVRDFSGQPFPAYVWAVSNDLNSPQAMVRTDSEGHFTLWYPEGKALRVFIDDESYSRTTYECWIVAEELKDDIRLDPRVGDFELWGLHAWRTQLNWQLYFWPCSLPLDLRSKRSGWKLPHFPRLTKEEIAVRINGAESQIKGLHRVRVWAGEGKTHPVYLLELPLKEGDPCGPQLIQVEVSTATRGRGEAWYIVW
ncbi:MAG: carboxypeptidase-like regulatory domain-containing protein [Candidatus Bipolaricaulota bacterium]|nr:carboxypeptidase-like regulatory domain-containing protein [Candidatus Bipolaricaulota bacterium]